MKSKLVLAAIVAALFTLTTQAQTNLTLGGPGMKIIQFLGNGSNWMFSTYGIYAEKGAGGKSPGYGGGLGAFVRVNDFLATGLRLDTIASGGQAKLWMPSGDIQIQAPITLFGKADTNGIVSGGVTVVPFGFGGVATPLAGRGSDNGTVVGIFGMGMALRIQKHWDLVYDWEKWTGFSGNQHRFGILYKF